VTTSDSSANVGSTTSTRQPRTPRPSSCENFLYDFKKPLQCPQARVRGVAMTAYPGTQRRYGILERKSACAMPLGDIGPALTAVQGGT